MNPPTRGSMPSLQVVLHGVVGILAVLGAITVLLAMQQRGADSIRSYLGAICTLLLAIVVKLMSF